MSGSKWGDANPSSTKTELNYYIYDNETTLDSKFGDFLFEEEETAFLQAMEDYSSVANISFTKSNSINDSHILWAVLDHEDSDESLGYAYAPGDGSYAGLTTINYYYYTTDEDELIDEDILLPGSYYYITAIHELGHAIVGIFSLNHAKLVKICLNLQIFSI